MQSLKKDTTIIQGGNVITINRSKLLKLITDTNGKFFTVDFTKLDGTLRTMTCRLGVKSKLKGGVNRVEALNNPYKVVYEPNKGEYRTINLSTVFRVKTGGQYYTVED